MNLKPLKKLMFTALAFAAVMPASADDALFSGYTLSPAAGDVTEINEILVNFPNMGDNKFTWNRSSMITLTHGETSYMGSVLGYGTQRAINFIDLSDPMNPVAVNVTTPGEWTLTIPEGTFKSGTEKNPLITAVYNVLEQAGPAFTADPVSGTQMDFPVVPMPQRYVFDFGTSTLSSAKFDEMATALCTYNSRTVSQVIDPASQNGYRLDFSQAGKLVVEVSPQVFTMTGELRLQLEEGYFTVDGKASPAIDYVLQYGEKSTAQMVVSPTPDTETAEMSHFVITFTGTDNVRISEWPNATITGPQSYSVFELTEVAGAEHPTFNLDFTPSPTYPGAYTLFIDKGTFIIDDVYENEETRCHYTFVKEDVDTSWEPSPNTGSVLNSDGNISVAIVFGEEEQVTRGTAFNTGIHVSLNGTEVIAGDYTTEFFMNNFMVNIAGDKFKDTEGTLALVIDAAALNISGKSSASISQTWNVVKEKEIQTVFLPEAGATVPSLRSIRLSFPAAETAAYYDKSLIQLRAADYSGYFATATVKQVEDAAVPTFELTFDPEPVSNGDYVLSAGYGSFFFNNVQSSEPIESCYTLDRQVGIEDIAVEGETVTVISIDGRTLLRNAPRTALSSLAPGFYVINGQKCLLK